MTHSWKLSHIISLAFVAGILMLGVAGAMAGNEMLMSSAAAASSGSGAT